MSTTTTTRDRKEIPPENWPESFRVFVDAAYEAVEGIRSKRRTGEMDRMSPHAFQKFYADIVRTLPQSGRVGYLTRPELRVCFAMYDTLRDMCITFVHMAPETVELNRDDMGNTVRRDWRAERRKQLEERRELKTFGARQRKFNREAMKHSVIITTYENCVC